MRVLLFSRAFSQYCSRYALALSRHCDVALVLSAGNAANDDIIDVSAAPGLDLHLVNMEIKRGGFAFPAKVARIVAAFDPDIIHFHEVPDPLSAWLVAALRGRARVFLTIHDPKPHSGADSRMGLPLRLAKGLGRRMADRLVVHGAVCRDEMLALDPACANRLAVSAHGVLMVPERRISADSSHLLMFGRMEAYKGLDTLVQALSILAKEGRRPPVTVAGKGEALERLAPELAGLGVRIINRYVPAEEALALMQQAAAVVLPYHDATQSGVVASAFGNRRPVIATRVGGLPDVVENGVNGLLVPPRDPIALAEAIRAFCSDPAIATRLMQGAEDTALGLMNWDRIADEMVGHYRSACGGG